MAVTLDQIQTQLAAFVNALDKIPPAARAKCPSTQVDKRYNSLLDQAKKAKPGIDSKLWPESLAIAERDDADDKPTACSAYSYGEITLYVLQLQAIVGHAPKA